ncbi:hypothetical protein A2697_03210 [Candidatus Curtissbacteria bacterium RIFCSPHIGHO2_01_FULL_41_44]|uniref:Uncharacterized protein n=1 Tax=Candidatus Curtissbacteria bacterium RIFCSPLOWO2_01_FULL_42_50 TaxID=1797730 RepID=A0A1F5H4R9_9BACT|nr:MAG: hypothetical protein A2697_03210 [Candidatus Curtissbacteria bacterium RIFCSPHIGHO2_01_FULL_41_44]OGD93541.1 MAG: hypothetical protein A3C33_00850 [Candidatus Curtissbacteria bacterium RIFCSPHIGHO2_02_FULL_42_58]OGD97849.1 MAG: hypothetical protein A3E71_04745 [Candidatus Curtissbacteria bacterium RIFCSPHIGHO2_12_FULL_42_33]OGD99047.1 MAG: hypothetical protein A3B54_04665 [Candidatus Curtissbacteria bacterium RIFCSPLOWO2_01_FULL_42_50]OGE03399.1 MAG: hypothetical protein A3G16_01585 [Ca
MKVILIFVLGAAIFIFIFKFYFVKTSGVLKPILPTVFFEPAEDSGVIAVDFSACAPAKGIVEGEFGAIKIEMWSYDVATCLMDYTSPEGKNFSTRCLVPRSLDKKTFNKAFKGVDFSEIVFYCKVI